MISIDRRKQNHHVIAVLASESFGVNQPPSLAQVTEARKGLSGIHRMMLYVRTTERREHGRLLLPEDSKIQWLMGEVDRLKAAQPKPSQYPPVAFR
jgi:hypothetical protein